MGDMALLLTLDMELLRLVNMVHPMKARMMVMVPQQLVQIVDMELQLIVVMVLQLVVLTLDMEPLRAVQVQNMELQLTVATARQLNMVLLQKDNLLTEIQALMTILLKLLETDEKINFGAREEKIIEMEDEK